MKYINEIVQGDCLELMQELPDGSVDFVFADPPYNVGKKYESNNDKLSPKEYQAWCKNWFNQAKRISRNSVAITPGMINIPLWIADIEKTHFILAWTKQNNCSRNFIGKTSGFQTWEPILVYGKSHTTILRDSVNCPISHQNDTGDHPRPKPLKLLNWIVTNFSKPNDIVLDPFAGSGTTLVAAEELGRQYIGFELEQKYVDICRRRLGQGVMSLDFGES